MLASLLSGEMAESSDEPGKFMDEDQFSTGKLWNDIGKMGNDKKIDVDKAWNSIYSRIEENNLSAKTVTIESRYKIRTLIRIAASVLILICLGTAMVYLNSSGALTGKIVVASNSIERNKEVFLPDGSKIYLNRNSELIYRKNLGHLTRNVTLKGEAFFDIKRDPSKPFIINTGKASVKVLGTSFSVLTNNIKNAVEVFVKTGTVLLSDSTGKQNIILEPGFIGTMNFDTSSKVLNEDPNYLSWNTDMLVYEKKSLDVVFADLKKVYGIDVVADNPDILKNQLTTTFEKEPQDTIIRIICSTFSFSYMKEGAVYHLSKR